MNVSLDAQDRWSTAPRVYWLWMGILLPPLAWAGHLTAGYALASAVCTPPAAWPFLLLSAGALALALGGGGLSARLWRETADEPEEAGSSRARGRFMVLSGMLLSGIFTLTIVAQSIPILMLEPCLY